jgi:hypothetical protein
MPTTYTIELHRGLLANRPASGGIAEPYFATDTNQLFIWNATSSAWVQTSAEAEAYAKALPIAVGAFIPGVLTDGQVCLNVVIFPSIKFPASAVNSAALASSASTGTVVFHLSKNGGADFATITFTSSVTGVFSQASDVTFNGTTDYLRIVGPATHDPTLANVGISLAGVRV